MKALHWIPGFFSDLAAMCAFYWCLWRKQGTHINSFWVICLCSLRPVVWLMLNLLLFHLDFYKTQQFVCVCASVYPSGAPGIYLCQWSGSSCHPWLTSGMFPESLRQVDLWKVHLSSQGLLCVLLCPKYSELLTAFVEQNWFCLRMGYSVR